MKKNKTHILISVAHSCYNNKLVTIEKKKSAEICTLVEVTFYLLIRYKFLRVKVIKKRIYFFEKKDEMLLVPLAALASAFSFAVTNTFS